MSRLRPISRVNYHPPRPIHHSLQKAASSKVGGGDDQKGRRKSIVEMISGQKAASKKVAPAGVKAKKEFEEAEFMREMKRRVILEEERMRRGGREGEGCTIT
mmetsp:Transcript_496/g.908  ORF Transcript_496/g.908 Transcript_496/m.908 type:complete len:102 (-) Transcript_496:224-529(-)|eukprot:CAMPEP_0182506172 /NCGR_PEP_ID=MMETSP1321-20130603/20704_1 /TAXON_ID=91990 /ORGANISM="Bolidomonas sp., Strain RCC1657" /LENGTH=101 /DNA_ID=CAMNT_0024711849 /DNA_START=132 /DNA_END=437 /DNA_ORIENTATION=-